MVWVRPKNARTQNPKESTKLLTPKGTENEEDHTEAGETEWTRKFGRRAWKKSCG